MATRRLFDGAQTELGILPIVGTAPAGAQTLTPALFTNDNTFFGATVTVGAVTLTPALFTNDQTFYAPTVSLAGGTQTLAPALFTNGQTFYAPTVTQTGGVAFGNFLAFF